MRGSRLAEKLNHHGVAWNRTTVAKFETGGRVSITVQELLALAQALQVPPVWLLIDPASSEGVPLSAEFEPDAWSALLWTIGRQPLPGRGADVSEEWARAEDAIELATAVAAAAKRLWSDLSANDVLRAVTPDYAGAEADEAAERRAMQGIVAPMRRLLAAGYVLPPLPVEVRERAEQLGVELPEDGR